MLSLLQKSLKSIKVCIYIVFNIQKKCAWKKNKNSRLQKTLCDFEPIFSWVRQNQDILGRWKLAAMIKTSSHQGTLQFFWNREPSLLKSNHCFLPSRWFRYFPNQSFLFCICLMTHCCLVNVSTHRS